MQEPERQPPKKKRVRRVISRPHRGRIGRAARPWEPSAIQLEAYSEVCAGLLTNAEIASKFGMSKGWMSDIVKKIEAWLAPQWAESVRQIKCRHTESLLYIFRQAMRAWEASKQPGITETIETESAEDGPKISRKRSTRYQTGDPAYLTEARAALSQIREIWGANAPIKVEHSGELRVAGQSVEEANAQLAEQLDAARQKLLAPSQN